MNVCHFCDSRNPVEATRCTSCGAELPGWAERPGGADARPAPAPAPSSDDSPLSAEVRRICHEQGKIQAIKFYRETTRVGLAEAKEAVERLMTDSPAAGSSAPTTAPTPRGCATVLVALFATATLIFTCIVAGAGRWPW